MTSTAVLKTNKTVGHISNVSSLARILEVNVGELIYISTNVKKFWIPGKTTQKKDGTPRLTNDARPELKEIHRKIKNRLLINANYPVFLNGGLPKCSIYTNASPHTKSKVLISEDIGGFYPSTTRKNVYDIWKYYFNCTPAISEILADLTTYEDSLPQGWIPSSYLANLIFWDIESKLVKYLKEKGFTYTRFVDDISISTKAYHNKDQITDVISQTVGMLLKKGYRVKRSKHTIRPATSQQTVNNLLVNNHRVGLPRDKRREIRAQVEHLEYSYRHGMYQSDEYVRNWRRAASSVGRLKKGHPKLYKNLRIRLKEVKALAF